MRLIHFRLCPYSRSIRFAFGELGLEPTLVEERPWEGRAAFLAINPAGELPVLELSTSLVLCGAYAISEFLAEEAAESDQDPRVMQLFPGKPEDRAEVRRLVDWFHRKFSAEVSRDMLREKVEGRLRPELSRQQPDAELLRALRGNLRYHLSYVSHLADQRRWLAGDEMSYADFAAAAHLSCLDYLDEVPWDAHPAARGWYVRLKSRPSFRALLADRLAGVPPSPHYGNLDF